jgi:hypothetical protein
LYAARSEQTPAAVWVEAVHAASDRAIVGTIAQLGLTGSIGALLEARRDSARAVLDGRLFERPIEVEERLEAAATRLGKIGIFATIVIGIATVVVLIFSSICIK